MKGVAVISLAIVSVALATLPTKAGLVADFEKSLRDAYGEYRLALFQTNAGDAERSAKALQSF